MGDTDVIRKHIEMKDYGSRARPRIVGSRIRVQDIVAWHIKAGMTIDEMEDNFPTISRADIYAALAYYWDDRDEIDQGMARDHEYVEKAFEGHVSILQEKLAQMRRDQR